MPVAAESSWTFINDAEDDALYFGGNIRTFEGITFLQIKVEGDPDGSNGDENAWNQAFNCKNKTYRGGEDKKLLSIGLHRVFKLDSQHAVR